MLERRGLLQKLIKWLQDRAPKPGPGPDPKPDRRPVFPRRPFEKLRAGIRWVLILGVAAVVGYFVMWVIGWLQVLLPGQ